MQFPIPEKPGDLAAHHVEALPTSRRVERYSFDRLLREGRVFPGVTLSAEVHNGRMMVRVEIDDAGTSDWRALLTPV